MSNWHDITPPAPRRLCGGTPAMPAWEYEAPGYLSGTTQVKRVKEGPAEPGCGHEVVVLFIPAELPHPADGQDMAEQWETYRTVSPGPPPRPMFVKEAEVVICPRCDGTASGTLPPRDTPQGD